MTKSIFLFTVVALLANGYTAGAQTRIDAKMIVDSVERQFIVVRPSGTVPVGGFPVVFMFHGSSGDGEKFYNISGWKEKGEVEKFITVFPSSLEYCIIEDSTPKRTTKWNNGDLVTVACPGQLLKNDVTFVRRMVDTLKKTFNINPGKIFASGFSNGGVFTSKLAVEMSDVFAALSCAEGFLHPLDSGAPARYIPVVAQVGTKDDRFYNAVGLPELPFNDSSLTYLNFMIRTYQGVMDLQNIYVKELTTQAIEYTYTLGRTAGPHKPFTFVLLKDLEHSYPNGTNYPLNATDFLWPLFVRAGQASGVDYQGASAIKCSVYPNPCSDYVMVSGGANGRFILSTVLGEQIFDEQFDAGSRIQISHVPAGLYMSQIVTNGTRQFAPIVVRPH